MIIPGNILQRYAVEGKTPIYLDKNKVRDFGFEPIEGAIFSKEKLESDLKIQHDPDKISLAVKALLYFKDYIQLPFYVPSFQKKMYRLKRKDSDKTYISDRMAVKFSHLKSLEIADKALRDFLPGLLWNNRDIALEHLHCFRGIQVIEPEHWGRSTEWDKILGYFDPADRLIKIRRDLFKLNPARLEEDLLIGIGESVLGKYFRNKAMRPIFDNGGMIGKVFEIELSPAGKRQSYLNDAQLRHFLYLSGMEESLKNREIFRKVLNINETFTPCGLLFGLFYAWYLNNQYGGEMEYEMSLVKQEISDLMPKQKKDFQSRSELIRFFREVVFKQKLRTSF